jgi:predicted permease
MRSLFRDFRYAFRVLFANPGFTSVVVLSLSLGIGANTAIFSLIDAVMLRILPVSEPERLLLVARTENGRLQSGFTHQQFRAMADEAQVAGLAGYSAQRLNVSIDGNLEPTAVGHLVSGNYFSLLGVKPFAGRAILAADDQVPNGHPVAMVSYRYWTRRFGRDPAILGRTISLSATPFTIIGITPPEFFGIEVGAAPDIFVPMMMQPAVMPVSENLLQDPNIYSTWIEAVARLKPGVQTSQAAFALLPPFARNVPPPKFGGPLPKLTIALTPAATGISALRRQFSQPLFILMTLVGLVLLIACANIANLFLARGAARNREFAVRLALGSGRWRLVRQLLAEGVVLSIVGGLGAILLAQWGTSLLLVYISSGRNPVALDLDPNVRVFAFTAAVSVATGILFGLASAMRAARLDLTPALKNFRSIGRMRSAGPGRILMVTQVSLSLVLLIGAGLFARSLQNLNNQDSGFPRDRVLIARIEPKDSDQRNRPGVLERLDGIYTSLAERIGAIPGIHSASLANVSPTRPNSGCCGVRDPATGEVSLIPQVMVYPDYFETLGIPLVAGRGFSPGDYRRDAAPVALINETLAQKRFPGENAIGLNLGQARIIGIVKDSKYTSLKAPTEPTYYMPFMTARTGRGQMILHVRTSVDSDLVRARVQEEVWKIDRTVPQFDIHTLAEEVDAVLVHERLIATLSGFLAGLALLLASVGLYGLLAFAVVQRTGEMGIRMALGAARSDVMRMILGEAWILVLTGIAIGIPAALGLSRFASSRIADLLYGLTPGDPVTIAAATVLLLVTATIAATIPARRASCVDPMVALRNE